MLCLLNKYSQMRNVLIIKLVKETKPSDWEEDKKTEFEEPVNTNLTNKITETIA